MPGLLWFPQRNAYMIASGVICFIYIICAVVLFLGVKERKGKCWYNCKDLTVPEMNFSAFDVIKLFFFLINKSLMARLHLFGQKYITTVIL